MTQNRFPRSPRHSHILGNTTLEQNFLRNPALFAQRDSPQAAPNSSSSSLAAPKTQMNARERNPVSYTVLQGTSKIISCLATAPIERVYLLMQSQNEMLKYGTLSRPYKGMKDCLVRTIKHEGVLSLWRGNSVSVISHLTTEAFAFTVVHLRRDRISKEAPEAPLWLVPVAAMAGNLFAYPTDYVRSHLATDVKASREFQFSLDSSGRSFSNAFGNRKFSGILDVFKKTLKSDGILGLYRGYTFACVGVSAHYYVSKKIAYHSRAKKQTEERTFLTRITPIVFLSLPMFCYPVTTICRRMMMTSGEAVKYKGVVDAIRQIVKHEGVSSLYKGVGAFVILSVAKHAVVLAFYYTAYSQISQINKRLK